MCWEAIASFFGGGGSNSSGGGQNYYYPVQLNSPYQQLGGGAAGMLGGGGTATQAPGAGGSPEFIPTGSDISSIPGAAQLLANFQRMQGSPIITF